MDSLNWRWMVEEELGMVIRVCEQSELKGVDIIWA